MADRKLLVNRNENENPIWKWNWGISDEKKVVCKTARRAHSQKVNKYSIIFAIQNSNFGTLANQHMSYQGH